MKAKLIKTDQGNYVLVDPTKGIYNKGYIIGSSRECDVDKLSIQNCQAIECGYDLNELAEFYSTMTVFIKKDEIPTAKQIEDAEYISEIAFNAGFQKALELMGDKKFTEEDIKECWDTAVYSTALHRTTKDDFGKKEIENEKNQFIQSLKQNEWDVEVEMKEKYESDGIEIISFLKPKLDEEGCLILKRI